MAAVSMKQLLETGVHFGHRTRRWNPKMKPYIFTERNGIHILDLQQTLKAIERTSAMVRDKIADGGTLMFVGTKRQAQETIAREAERCGMPYVNQRWLGGTLTNWRTIRQRIDYLKELEGRRDRGEFDLLTKKEALMRTREIEKLNYRLGGIREMKRQPDLLYVVDVHREHTAVHEANILGVPIVAVVDTNCDPDLVDHIIPANDDAIRAIKLLTATMADAVLEGINMRKDVEVEEAPEIVDLEAITEGTDEDLLGEATLAKLQDGTLEFEGERSGKAKETASEASQAEKEGAASEATEADGQGTESEATDAEDEETASAATEAEERASASEADTPEAVEESVEPQEEDSEAVEEKAE